MEYRNWIDGEWVEPSGERTLPNVNPADTRDVLGTLRLSSREDVRRAVAGAKRAFPAWRRTPAPERARVVARAQKILEAQADELARLLTREEGKVLAEARGEVAKTINVLEFMAGEGYRMGGITRPSVLPSNFCYTVRQPLGVVGLITPWNFPVCIPAWKIAPALIAGNTIVFKPSELTPATAEVVVRAFIEAGCPAGVLQLVHGDAEAGDEIVRHPEIPAISFTGSNEVGRSIYETAAGMLKKVQCEMGGKNPIVVLEDADLELAAAGAAKGAFGSTGQRCTATSRAIVHEAVADRFVELVAEHARRIVPGNGLQEGVTMGPSVDREQFDKVLSYIEIGKQEGATLVLGGSRAEGEGLEHGYFPAPTIFDHVRPGMRIAREEIFGPVLSVIRVRDLDEAIEIANDVEYGLTSSLYTRDPNRWFRFVDEIETGITHLNSPTPGGESQMPFGGVKATGVGAREMGDTAIDFFTELKAVYVDYTGAKRESNVY
ncbi:MAG: aldehyde dehydrogenase family protein [Planctomycetota bacterium]|nr:MAG: aldehyde dehydrogenase family protein [Planctomycetota bacterium]